MRAIEKIAARFADVVGSVHSARLRLVWDLVETLAGGARATVTSMGRALARNTSDKHGIKSADRALSNPHLYGERLLFYRSIAREAIGKQSRPRIVVDATDHGPQFDALRATVVGQGRGVTILNEVYSKQSRNHPRTHTRFLSDLATVLPPGCRPILILDGGFRGPFFRKVRRRGWDYVGRLSGGNRLLRGKCRPKVRDLFCKLRPRTPTDLGIWTVTRRKTYNARIVFYDGRKTRNRTKAARLRGQNKERKRRLRASEPWALATSCTDLRPKQIVDIYRCRMQIEECFRDDKSHRFGRGLELGRCRKRRRLAVLLLLIALASFVLLLIGLVAEQNGLARHFQANTVRKRRVVSLVFLGTRVFHSMHATKHIPSLPNALKCLRNFCAQGHA